MIPSMGLMMGSPMTEFPSENLTIASVSANETISDPNPILSTVQRLNCSFYMDSSPPFPPRQLYCEGTDNGLSCWPPTTAGTTAVIPCFSSMQGINYDTSDNATRFCFQNGTWDEKSNYLNCKPIPTIVKETDIGDREALLIFYIGYGVSLVALTVALWIFYYFKDLRCVRNTIHSNLMITYTVHNLIWMITATLQSQSSSPSDNVSCYIHIILTYFLGTNFFWMFIEGLYLYILVVKTFSIELINIHRYILVGYGAPALMVLIWAPIKWGFGSLEQESTVEKPQSCLWQTRQSYDYIFIIPIIIVLLVNIFFLGKIMYVLITKLRAATTAESQQYRKAAKALLVLIPLLGVTYLLVIVTPPSGTAKMIFRYLQAVLVSSQGFSVSVLYCFLNAEVQQSVRHHIERWKTVRTLRGGEYPVTPRSTVVLKSTRYGEGVKLYRCRHEGHPRTSRGNHSTSYTSVRRSEDMMF